MTDSAIKTEPDLPCDALVVMGVSGCGKSSVAQACSAALGWPLFEGDAFHDPRSIEKMRAGIALTDGDRAGWLDRLAGLLTASAAPTGAVMTCSALRLRYRDRLRHARPGVGFVFLQLGYEDALARVRQRPGHLFPPTLVASQFDTLESPVGEPGVLTLDATRPLDTLVAQVLAAVAQSQPFGATA